MSDAIVLRAERWVDVEAGEVRSPAVVVVEGDRIAAVDPREVPGPATEIDLGDVTLLPGLMDMELNMLLGGPSGGNPRSDVQDDPAFRTLRGTLNCRTTLLAGFTTARNLGLFVKTGGYLLDVALSRAIDNGWVDGPRLVPAGHAITPTGGHLDPTMFQRLGPGIMPLNVEEGIANGVAEVRTAVRYQIKYGARLIKISASGGVMSHSGLAGAQQYSDEELAAIVDEAHRAGLKVAAHAHGDAGIRACITAGVDCIEHGSLASDDTIRMMVEHGTFLVPTSYLSEGLDVSRAAPELQAKAAEVFPKARAMLGKAIAAGVKIACGTDAPAIPHGDNAKELWAMVDRGMSPMQALQAATIHSAELIDVDDRGRLAAGLLADIVAVPGDPSVDITTTQDVCFVMKGGRVYKGGPTGASGDRDARDVRVP
jgi:imidazolonepropionase-like amidohydrolase